MIFVTVGNHYQGFDRLIRKMDEIAGHIDEKVIMQIGFSKYRPVNAEYFSFKESFEEIKRLNSEARIVISHAGVGCILTAFEQKTPLILVPRRKMYNEHCDDHQLPRLRAAPLKEQKKGQHGLQQDKGADKIIRTVSREDSAQTDGKQDGRQSHRHGGPHTFGEFSFFRRRRRRCLRLFRHPSGGRRQRGTAFPRRRGRGGKAPPAGKDNVLGGHRFRQQRPCHAVGRRGVVAFAGEKCSRLPLADNGTVKKQRTAVSITGAEF
jgi:hypothetical protein